MTKVIEAQWDSFYSSVLADDEQDPGAGKAAAAQDKVKASI